MLKIGITGGIGSGKTIVSTLIEAMGFSVFNSDFEAKKIIRNDNEVRSALIELCGEEIFNADGLNRTHLAQLIFNDDSLLKKVNALIHPKVRESFDQFAHDRKGLVFNEAAILFETGAHTNFDRMILVTAPKDIRIERVMKRDSVSKEAVLERINKQWSDEQKEKLADYIVVNDNRQPLLQQVEKIIDQLSSS